MNLTLISITEQQNIWPKKVSTSSTIGLMNEHGTHWGESLVVSIVFLPVDYAFHVKNLKFVSLKSIGTIYPGLMLTSAVLYHVMNFLHISIDVRNVCVFLAPLFSSLTTIVTFFLTRELKVLLHFYNLHRIFSKIFLFISRIPVLD